MATFLDLIRERNIPYKEVGEHHHATRGRIQIDCPFCSPDSNRFRMGYSINKGHCTCWTCGFHATSRVISALLDIPYHQAKNLVEGLERYRSSDREVYRKLYLPVGRGPLLPIHKDYLLSRGFDPEEICKLWRVEGIGLASDLAWRLFIPIHKDGQIVSWTTRSLGDVVPRYINARPEQEKVSARKLLYGEDYAIHAIVVVEGPTDAWRIGPGAVATMGLSYSNEQVLRISKYPVRAICFDNEPDAQRRARSLCHQLSSFPGETHLIQLDAKDPGEATDTEVQEIRKRFLK